MNVDGIPYRSIWVEEVTSETPVGIRAGHQPPGTTRRTHLGSVWIIDQTRLPHQLVTLELPDVAAAAHAIASMQVRGAPLIGATAAYGLALAMRQDPSDRHLGDASARLLATRPTAVNLRWAVDDLAQRLHGLEPQSRAAAAFERAAEICEADIETNRRIGDHGLGLLKDLLRRRSTADPLNVLTHCNAGWLATVDWGTALAPIYRAHSEGVPIHVWIDETRPRNQGYLTAWELEQHGIAHTLIVDNAGGHLMQRGMVDTVIVGTDRTTASGDVCNKIGTYLKALAARDNDVPFYVALPSSTIDWNATDGLIDIPIEERDAEEVHCIRGRTASGGEIDLRVTPATSRAANPAFDVTPAHLVTRLITERGVCAATPSGLAGLFPEHAVEGGRLPEPGYKSRV